MKGIHLAYFVAYQVGRSVVLCGALLVRTIYLRTQYNCLEGSCSIR